MLSKKNCCFFVMSISVFALLVFFPFFHMNHAATKSISLDNLEFSVDMDSGYWKDFSLFGKPFPGEGGIFFRDGFEEVELTLRNHRITEEIGGSLSGKFGFKECPEVTVEYYLEYVSDREYVNFTVKTNNLSNEQKWFENRIEIPFPVGDFLYHDGFAEHSQVSCREDLTAMFPLASVYNPGGGGLAVGLQAGRMVSYLKNSLTERKGHMKLSWIEKIVVDPGESYKQSFVLFPFKARYGYLDAISIYQDLYPAYFHPCPDVHPEIHGPGQEIIWRTQHEDWLSVWDNERNPRMGELVRKFNRGWEWCYIGFGYRPGDWLCTEELTGDWRIRHREGRKFRDRFNRSASEHLQMHYDTYEKYPDWNVAPMMYVIPTYCEEDLADEIFADSIYYDKFGDPRVQGPPWVVDPARCYMMYAHGNSFGDYTFDAVEKIINRPIPVSGFAYDCINGARYNYFGPGAEVSPARSFEKGRGVYSNMEIAPALFIRHVRSFERDGFRMGVAGNHGVSTGSFMPAFEMDAGIIESQVWDEPRNELIKNYRLWMGRKSLTYWVGFQRLRGAKLMTSEQIETMVKYLEDYALMQSLELGIYLNHKYITGSPKLIYYNNISQELFRELGWEPVPAFRAQEELKTSRYGRGLGAVIVIGNPTLNSISADLEVDNLYFGEGGYVFADYEGRIEVPNRIHGPKTYIDNLTVQERQPLLLRAVAAFSGSCSLNATGQLSLRSGEKGKLLLEIESSEERKTHLSLFIPRGFSAGQLKVNGGRTDYSLRNGIVKLPISLKRGKNEIMLVYNPEIKIKNIKDVLDFNFFENGRALCDIVISSSDDERDEIRAVQLKTFFDVYVYEHDLDRTLGFSIIQCNDYQGNNDKIVLGTPESCVLIKEAFPAFESGLRGVVFRSGNNLYIVGKNGKSLEDTLNLFLSRLDEIYPFFGYKLISEGVLHMHAQDMLGPSTLYSEITGQPYVSWER